MKADELLLWLSARRQGSWQQFRAAVEQLHSGDNDSDDNGTATISEAEFSLHQQLRLDLERLAHVEFFAQGCEKGWRVTPPTFAAHPIPEGMCAVLCGARSPALRQRVLRISEKVVCKTLDYSGVPEVIRFFASDSSALAEAAARAEVFFQADAPLGILSHLPPCNPPSHSQALSEFPVGKDWNIHEFDTSVFAWRKTDRRHALAIRFGVLCFSMYFQRRRYFLRWKGATFELPRAIALYALLQHFRRDLLHYDVAMRKISVPAICRPPRLLERALVLCSGLPPAYDKTTANLSYSDVPYDIALFAADLLRQRLI